MPILPEKSHVPRPGGEKWVNMKMVSQIFARERDLSIATKMIKNRKQTLNLSRGGIFRFDWVFLETVINQLFKLSPLLFA